MSEEHVQEAEETQVLKALYMRHAKLFSDGIGCRGLVPSVVAIDAPSLRNTGAWAIANEFQQDSTSCRNSLLEIHARTPEAGQVDQGSNAEYRRCSESQVEINPAGYHSSHSPSIQMSLSVNSLSSTFLQLDLMKMAREELNESMPVRVGVHMEKDSQQQALPLIVQSSAGEHLQLQDLEESQSRNLEKEGLHGNNEEPDLEYHMHVASQDLQLKYYKVKVWRLLSRVMELLERKRLFGKQVEKFSDPGCNSRCNVGNYQPIEPALSSKQSSSDFTARPVTQPVKELLLIRESSCPQLLHAEFTQSTLDLRNNRVKDRSSPTLTERKAAAFQYKGSSPIQPQRLSFEDVGNVKPKRSSPKGVSHQGQIKTELCKNWQENGDCPYSIHCRFAHGVRELRPVIRHPLYKTQICRMLLEGKVCIYGHRCHFRHELTDEEISMILRLNDCPT